MVDDIEGPDYVKAVHHLDAEVKIENKQISDQQRVIVNRNGILRLQTMLKISVSGCYNQQTQAFLEYTAYFTVFWAIAYHCFISTTILTCLGFWFIA